MQLISVIVPLYKGNKYIDNILGMINNNINTLRNNNPGLDVELIFVNDYPEEEITRDNFKNYDFEIRLINNERNVGIHDSRVAGIENAQGEYIYMLDQDDIIEDNYLSTQLDTLTHNPDAVFVICNGYIQHKEYTRLIYENELMHKLSTVPKAYAYLDNRIISPGQCVIKKKAIPEFWMKNALKNNGADDLLLWLLVFSNNQRAVINPLKLYTHVNTDTNTSLDLNKMFSSVDEMVKLIKTNEKELNVNSCLISLVDYRNKYLWRKPLKSNINMISKFIIRFIYAARALKNRRN